MTTTEDLPVSAQRVSECLESASHWATALLNFGDRNQALADFWAIATGIVGAITSVAVWPALSDTSSTLEKFLISLGALATAICQLIPRVRNYAEIATQAKELASQYGALKGKLEDLKAANLPQGHAQAVIADFQATKAKKDSLRRIPPRNPGSPSLEQPIGPGSG